MVAAREESAFMEVYEHGHELDRVGTTPVRKKKRLSGRG